jgi:hypothetical protein
MCTFQLNKKNLINEMQVHEALPIVEHSYFIYVK